MMFEADFPASTRRLFLKGSGALGTMIGLPGLTLARAATGDLGFREKSAIRSYRIANTDLEIPRLGYGPSGAVAWNPQPIGKEDIEKTSRLIHTAYDQGIRLFDHADLYAFGKAEAVFGEMLRQSPGLRDKILIQSKCGQKFSEGGPGAPIRVDLSREHLVSSVEGSLKRLGTDRLDILLLHAVDALVEPQEVAQAFEDLHRSGKVRHFGVSNYNASQIELLRKSVRQPIVVNQIPIGLADPQALAEGMEFTLQLARGGRREADTADHFGGGTVDYCRLNGIQVQAYSPLRGVLKLPADANERLKATVKRVGELAKKHNTTPAVVALAWLLRHPANIVPILGGDKPEHLIEDCAADRLELSREEWYDLFAAAA
jgi:predicted oxidoreductase